MSTHNICFRGEIRKIFTRYPPLSMSLSIYSTYFNISVSEQLNLYLDCTDEKYDLGLDCLNLASCLPG